MDVEYGGIGEYGMMLIDLRVAIDRPVPAGKIDYARAGSKMCLREGGAVQGRSSLRDSGK